jgi:hypothetical protein
VLGEKVYSETISGARAEINIKNIPTGIYFVNVQTENGSMTKKIIKQ